MVEVQTSEVDEYLHHSALLNIGFRFRGYVI
jgi:hypothetical protein